MVRYTEYIAKISKSALYRKAISFLIESNSGVTEAVLYMPLKVKEVKEQVHIDSCKEALEDYCVFLQTQCSENVFLMKGKGITQKKNRYSNSTLILQAIINYMGYLYEETNADPIIQTGLRYIQEHHLLWKSEN